MRELERDYARWEQVYMAGSKDPFWPDGVNANLCRNHILSGKKRIRELYPDAEMPGIYYRPLPQKLPAEYMARKEELRSAALRSYTRYISDEIFCFIRNHVERIPETDALRGILDALLARADVLKDAVLSGDYVAMRRYADAGSLLASLKSGAERLRDWAPPEQEQLDLFTDYAALEQKKQAEKVKKEKERKLQEAVLSVKKKYGKNAMLKGMNLQEGATSVERNRQIGGHKA